MPHRSRGLWMVVALAGLGFAAPAKADQTAAQACANGLPPEAMTIYQDAAPHVTPNTDVRSLLTTRVKALIVAGSVRRETARGSAKAAYACLKELQ
jgi:hypothetical protein